MPARICVKWSKHKQTRFKNDVLRGMSYEDMQKKYKIGKNTILSTIRYFGMVHPKSKMSLNDGLEELVVRLFPNHDYHEIMDEVSKTFGRTICRKTITNIATKYNLQKDKEHIAKVQSENGKLGLPNLLVAMQNPEYRESLRRRTKSLYDKERWRIAHGLEQKTKYSLNLNNELAKKRWVTKQNLVKRNNYFSEIGSRTLYYDEETRRSKVLEERYKYMFDFVPAEDFDEENSKWVS